MPKPHLKPLDQQVIVITGASSGIGLATARMAGERGARLALIARNEEALQEICQELNEKGTQAVYVAADVGDRTAIERAADLIVEKYGRIDTWVNDAGVGLYGTLEETSEEDHRRLFDTNYWGVVNGTMAALRHLKHRGGAVVNIGSIVSEMPQPLLSAYSATKFAVKGFTESLRMEILREKSPVSVTLIKPAAIDTPFGPHARNYMDPAAKVPPPAYHPDLVADAILYAAENPTRSLTVGGAGQSMIWFFNWMPRLAERLLAAGADAMARDPDHAKPRQDALYAPVRGAPRTLGRQAVNRSSSLWTQAQMNRPTLAAVLGVVTLAAIGYAAFARARRRAEAPPTIRSVSADLFRQAQKRAKRAEKRFHHAQAKVERLTAPLASRFEREARAVTQPLQERARAEWKSIVAPVKKWARDTGISAR